MSNEFFEALEQGLQSIDSTKRLEYRLYYEEEQVLSVKIMDTSIEESNYIVVDDNTFDKVNGQEKYYSVVDGEVKFTPNKKRSWFLKQDDLPSNPYAGV